MKPPRVIKVLVVDDNDTDRAIIKQILLSSGLSDAGLHIEVDEAQDGASGIFKFENNSTFGGGFEIVIVDWQMPKRNGLSVVNLIRKEIRHRDVKIVMVTGMADEKHVEEAIDAGVNDYIVKPITPDVFLKKIKKLCGV